jgi:DNA-directed RNA polymerase subunit RPC12/RpoP
MGLEDLKQVVAKYRCDRCYRAFLIEELTEDPATPGILVCKDCIDELGFEEMKAESPRTDIKHYFRT